MQKNALARVQKVIADVHRLTIFKMFYQLQSAFSVVHKPTLSVHVTRSFKIAVLN
jgi:hypothetical protein